MTAAIHGDELNGVKVLQEVADRYNPSEIHGTLVWLHVVNVPAYQAQQRYIPIYDQDLNRSFPGRERSNTAERHQHQRPPVFDAVGESTEDDGARRADDGRARRQNPQLDRRRPELDDVQRDEQRGPTEGDRPQPPGVEPAFSHVHDDANVGEKRSRCCLYARDVAARRIVYASAFPSPSMNVALVTVGDELLAGDTANTNATWLCRRLTAQGATVVRVLTIPDDRRVIADAVRDFSRAFDACVVTGGLGGTPDDVTKVAVADALDRALVVDDEVRAGIVAKAEAYAEQYPDLADAYDLDVDFDAQAAVPEGARPLVTDESFGPGFVADNVYAFPGIPDELHVMFDLVVDEFEGGVVSASLYTPAPEGALNDRLTGVRDRFDVSVGSYPGKGRVPTRIKVSGPAAAVDDAVAWLRERVDVTDPSESASDG
jgi:molybdenum cofactor synthesis domain-containing protein